MSNYDQYIMYFQYMNDSMRTRRGSTKRPIVGRFADPAVAAAVVADFRPMEEASTLQTNTIYCQRFPSSVAYQARRG